MGYKHDIYAVGGNTHNQGEGWAIRMENGKLFIKLEMTVWLVMLFYMAMIYMLVVILQRAEVVNSIFSRWRITDRFKN